MLPSPTKDWIAQMSYKHLSEYERYQITVLLQAGITQKAISVILKRHESTISREIKRNSECKEGYIASEAILKAKIRCKNCDNAKRIEANVWAQVEKYLKRYYSPEQIAARLNGKVSVTAIYQYIYRDKARYQHIKPYLRRNGKTYRHRRAPYQPHERQYKRPIKLRPIEVELRKIKGHWEGDTIVSRKDGQALVTLVERKTGLLLMGRVIRPTAENTLAKIIELLTPFKAMVRSITFDNGTEFSAHRAIEYYLNTKVYFAEPYKSWQRGTNENTNGLIRQFIPKSSRLSLVSDEQIQTFQYLLNTRPRKRHDFKTPVSFFTKELKQIALRGVI